MYNLVRWYFSIRKHCLRLESDGDIPRYRDLYLRSWLFSVFPQPPKNFFWKISENFINRFEYKPESLSFKLILKVKDSDTNFVHTFSLSSHAF